MNKKKVFFILTIHIDNQHLLSYLDVGVFISCVALFFVLLRLISSLSGKNNLFITQLKKVLWSLVLLSTKNLTPLTNQIYLPHLFIHHGQEVASKEEATRRQEKCEGLL